MSYIPTSETLTVGGRVFTDLTNLKVLEGNVGQTSGAATLREPNGTTGYQVPSGKTFKMMAIEVVYGSLATGIAIGYGDNDVGMASVSYPTNVVFTGNDQYNFAISGATPLNTYQTSVMFNVPSLKYPCAGTIATPSSAVASIKVYGYEV